MWLALASITALLFINQDVRSTIQKAFMMMMVSLIGWVKYIRVAARRSKGCREYLSVRYVLTKEVWHNYRAGVVSRNTLFEFILFRTRMWAARHLENGHLTTADRGVYDLVYYDGDRRFRIRFPKNRGVRQIIHVTTRDNSDVTNRFLELLGPGRNFHGIPTTPALLGWNEGLKVQYRNGTEIEYSSIETIQLNAPRS